MKLLRKGQVGGLQGFILSIVTVTIVLAIGLIILSELTTVAKELDTSSVINETVAHGATVNQGGTLFIGASRCANQSISQDVFEIGVGCNVSSTGVVSSNGTVNVGIDYTHFTPSGAFNATNSIITKLATVPTWIGIIIIVALAFIVLSFFIGKRQ